MQDIYVETVNMQSEINSYSIACTNREYMILYLNGNGTTVTLNGSVYLLNEGDAVLISPDDFYYIHDIHSIACTCIKFTSNNLYDFSSINKIVRLTASMKELFTKIAFTEDTLEQKIQLQSILNELGTLKNTIEPIRDEKSRLYSKAVTVMERYIASWLSVDELASMLRLSLSGLKRLFLKYTGIGVHEHFLMLKLKKAQQLLKAGNSITRVARVLQFSSQAYFSTTFKRVVGISAKKYSMLSQGLTSGTRKPAEIKRSKKVSKPSEPSDKRAPTQTSTHKSTPEPTPSPSSKRSTLPDYLL